MRILIHGDDLTASRSYLSSLKIGSTQTEVITLDARSADLNVVILAVESPSLFSPKKTVVIERLFSHPSSTTRQTISTYLNSLPPNDPELIVWEPKKLFPSQIKTLSSYNPKEFKTPTGVFAFLDQLAPGSPHNLVNFRQALSGSSAEFALFMLAARLRDLAMLDANSNLRPWQLRRLKQQRSLWPDDKLISLHRSLTDLDNRFKTGRTVLPLKDELELVLLKT